MIPNTRFHLLSCFSILHFLALIGTRLHSFLPVSRFSIYVRLFARDCARSDLTKVYIQSVSKKADTNLYKIKSSITSPAFNLTGLLQHSNSLIIQKISNSWDDLSLYLREKPITYVIKSDMNFKDFFYTKICPLFWDSLYMSNAL